MRWAEACNVKHSSAFVVVQSSSKAEDLRKKLEHGARFDAERAGSLPSFSGCLVPGCTTRKSKDVWIDGA